MNRKPILVLSNELANMISAGEVVERPVSVVKELVENAIDANASSINIELHDSGLKYICVTDNGIGMSKEDIPVALKRHATSKIANKVDLFSISSLGFRGEALPSIASVSKMRITSSIDGITGYFYEFVNLEIIDEGLIASRQGTKIEVEDLFYNTPARYKHLSNLSTELAKIMEFVNRLAIAYPNIAFSVTNNSKNLLQTQGDNNIINVISNVYGNDVAKNLIKFKDQNSLYSISGYTTKNSVFRSNKNYINIIVNDRIIRNQQLIYAITDAYKTILPVGKYPIVILKIKTDPTLIDVNVHPSKLEIRFTEEYELRRLITKALEYAIKNVDLVYEDTNASVETLENFDNFKEIESQLPTKTNSQPRVEGFKVEDVWKMFEEEKIKNDSININEDEDKSENELDDEDDDSIDLSFYNDEEYILNSTNDESITETLNEDVKNVYQPVKESYQQTELLQNNKLKFTDLKYIGQFNHTYLLFEHDNNLYLIDQHAGMERFMYEKILKSFENTTNESYELLIPINIELSSSEIIILENKISELVRLGFGAEIFGSTTILFRTIPTWVPSGLEVEFIHDIINHILTNQNTGKQVMYDSLAKKMSCKKSIKAHMSITELEVKSLLEKLDQCKMPYTCPHGRPTLIKLSLYEIEKMFKRVM